MNELGSAFCSTQPSTQVPSLTSKMCCQVGYHVTLGTLDSWPHLKWEVPIFFVVNNWDCIDWQVIWDLGLGTPSEVVNPNFFCSQRLRLHGLTSSDLGLRNWDPCEVVSPNLFCSQRLRLHGLTSSDLGLRTWDPCEVVCPNFFCSECFRLHGLTSNDLGIRTWDPLWYNP